MINPSISLFSLGKIAAQVVEFSGSKQIDKVSINFTTTAIKPLSIIVGQGGTISFQASNFQMSRKAWIFQPIIHWLPSDSWETSGTTIINSLQNTFYSDSDDAIENAPFLSYNLYFDEDGVYDLWGYGYVSSNIFWSFNGDVSDLHSLSIGSHNGPPQWTKFGSVYVSTGGQYSFSIYLSDATKVVLDQWYFTKNKDFAQEVIYANGEFSPLSLSKSPFNTILRLRSLNGNSLDELESPASGSVAVSSWLSSQTISSSGLYHYIIKDSEEHRGVIFDNGLSLEVWQIGGNEDHFVSWDFTFNDEQENNAFVSLDFGQMFSSI